MSTDLHIPSEFDNSNLSRNKTLSEKFDNLPTAVKTGTTIVGVLFDQGVVLAADTRASAGSIVADKYCQKIHYLAPNMRCCGAGTAADCDKITELGAAVLTKHSLDTSRPPRVISAVTFFRQRLWQHQGHIGAALIIGGHDPVDGPSLYEVHPHGSYWSCPFVTMGSGSLAAMSILESHWKEGLTKDEAVKLATEAIRAGIFNDMGSGGNIDCSIITADGVDERRPFEAPTQRKYRAPIGTFQHKSAQIKSDHTVPARPLMVAKLPLEVGEQMAE
ncbi:hypothetical protein P9112_012964 [Eukaryota sp. TZLM1-RC]